MDKRLSRWLCFVGHLAVFVTVLLPVVVHAHAKTDVVTLVNGNQITGEIKGLLQGRLSFGTDSMGTVTIEWEDVLSVNSQFEYEVRLVDGNRFYGPLTAGSEPGSITVLEKQGAREVEVLAVVELREIESTISDRFDIRLGIGYSYAKAADVGSITAYSELSYEDRRGITRLDGRTSKTRQDGGSIGSNRYSIARQIWTKRKQVVRWFDGSYEDNDELQLDYRYTAGFGLGKAFVDTNRQSLIAFLGIQGATERSLLADRIDSLEGVFGATYSLWRFDTPELDLETDLTFYPGITESGRWRGNANIRLSWELVEDLFWDVTAWGTHDNRSQSGTDTDYGITTGIGWTY